MRSPLPAGRRGFGLDIHPDGQRFLMIKPAEPSAPAEIILAPNWSEELKCLVSTDK